MQNPSVKKGSLDQFAQTLCFGSDRIRIHDKKLQSTTSLKAVALLSTDPLTQVRQIGLGR